MPDEIDRTRVEALAKDLFAAVRPTLATQPLSSDNVFVALNALAFVVATIIAGADRRAFEFFNEAVIDNMQAFDELRGAG
jgi:hypothetical protein